ncbi:MAG: hypothetical protein AAGH71_07500 [Planctomycetota bacterium]
MIELVVIVGYLLFLIVIGAVFRRFNSNTSDYFRLGCRGSWWLVGASTFMSVFSAWTFTGAAGAAFESGWSILVIFLANVAAFAVHAALLAPWFRQLRVVTSPEVIRKRFGPVTQQMYAWLYAILGLLYAAVWLWSLSVFVAAVFDVDNLAAWLNLSEVQFLILLVGVVVMFYSVSGGSWAVMATDVVQSLVLIPLTLLVAFLCLVEIGGVTGFLGAIADAELETTFAVINEPGTFAPIDPETLEPQESHPDFWKYTWLFAAATIIYKVTTFSTIDVAQRYFGVKDGREARSAALLAGGLMLLGMVFWFIPPMVSRLLWHDDVMAVEMRKPAEAAYAIAGMNTLPKGLIGIMVVAMLSATMSSMDSGLNKSAAIITRDVAPPMLRRLGLQQMTDRTALIVGQIATLILGLLIITIALYFAWQPDDNSGGGVFEAMLNIGAMLTLPMAMPLAIGLFVRRVPPWSAFASVGAAFVPSLIQFAASKNLVPDAIVAAMPDAAQRYLTSGWPYYLVVFVNIAAGTIGFLVTMPFWPKVTSEYRERVDEFFETMHTPVRFEEEVGESNDGAQLRVIGTFAGLLGLGICLLLAVPGNSLGDRLGILFVGGTVAVAGIAALMLGRRTK